MSDASFGDVTAEYMALRTASGLVEPAHEIVWVRGAGAVPFLDGLLSQDIGGILTGGVSRSFLLGPRGKLTSLLWVMRADGEVGLLADPSRGADLAEALDRYRFRVEASIDPDEGSAVEVWGPRSAEVLESAGLPVPAGFSIAV